jgi:hypothetical protein
MATEFIKKMTDDIDPDVEAAGTRTFAVDGRQYEIDLGVKNNARFDSDLDKYIQHARHVGSKHAPKVKGVNMARSSGYNSEQLVAIREWGRRNGWPNISSKGKVAREVIAAFEDNAGAEVVSPEPQFSAT